MNHTFRQQAEAWLAGLEQRKRKPVSPATIATYQQHVTRLLPLVGADTLLENINNGTLKDLANQIQGSPKTINESLMALKQIVASVVDPATGEPIYTRTWNHTFIDAPSVENQKQPCATVEQINTAIRTARSWQEQLAYTVLAATGMRISELLAIRVGPEDALHHNNNGELDQTAFLEAEGVIKVRASIWHNQEYPGKLKTTAAKRDIDLDQRLPSRIAEFISKNGIKPGEFLFQSETAGVANLETFTRRLRLRKLPGFHSLRRFRVTHLRGARIPEDILRWWLGHSGEGITDRYSKLAEDLEYRKHWAKSAGLGFDLQALGSPKRERKHRPRIERMLKAQADVKPEAYHAVDSDLPAYLFAAIAQGEETR